MSGRHYTGRRARIASAAIQRPIGTIMLISVLIVLGTVFLSRLSLDLLPSIVYPTIRASVTNAGVDPHVMEETVAKPMEAALATTENIVTHHRRRFWAASRSLSISKTQ